MASGFDGGLIGDDGDDIIVTVKNTFVEIRNRSPPRQKALTFSYPKGSLTMSPLGIKPQPSPQGLPRGIGNNGVKAESKPPWCIDDTLGVRNDQGDVGGTGDNEEEADFQLVVEEEPGTPRTTQAIPEFAATPVRTLKSSLRWSTALDTPEGSPLGMLAPEVAAEKPCNLPPWPKSLEPSSDSTPSLGQQHAVKSQTFNEASWQLGPSPMAWNQAALAFPPQLPHGPSMQQNILQAMQQHYGSPVHHQQPMMQQHPQQQQKRQQQQQQQQQRERQQAPQLRRLQTFPPAQPPSRMGSPVEYMPLTQFGLHGFYFKFTLRRADDVELGLEVARERDDQVLLIKAVLPGCAIEAWNKQCEAGASWKAVMCGDQIVKVNKALGCDAMLQECKTKQLLEIVVVRESANRG